MGKAITLICNVPFQKRMENKSEKKNVYKSDDPCIPTTDEPVSFPISNYLGAVLKKGDRIKAVLVAKTNHNNNYIGNLEICRKELIKVSETAGADLEIKEIVSQFKETRDVYNKLIIDIIDEIIPKSSVYVDMTYGPKDCAIILFNVLRFAERFCNCDIDNIMYGQAEFENDRVVSTRLCEMTPLFKLEPLMSRAGSRESLIALLNS